MTLKVEKKKVKLASVLYVPSMACNLIFATKVGRQIGAHIVMRSGGTCVL